MIRQTGGFALSATSTRSSSAALAMRSASGRGLMPSWAPSTSIRRTSRARIRSLIRGSSLGGGAMADHCSRAHPFGGSGCTARPKTNEADAGKPTSARPPGGRCASIDLAHRATLDARSRPRPEWPGGDARGRPAFRSSCRPTRVQAATDPEDSSVSLWTPGGEHEVPREPAAADRRSRPPERRRRGRSPGRSTSRRSTTCRPRSRPRPRR